MMNPAAAAAAGRHKRAKKNEHHVTAVPMPDDLTIEILSYLPAKSLVRFKSVSTDWSTIIESPSFVSKHYRCPNNNGARILGVSPARTNGHHPAPYISYYLNNVSDVYSHDVPGEDFIGNVQLFGPVDGIFCINCDYSGKVALWNPATNQLKHLPHKHTYRDKGSKRTSMLAFGLNPETNCYKVVWFFKEYNIISPSQQVWIYDLSDIYSSWRSKISSLKKVDSGNLSIRGESRYMKGVYYWLASETSGGKFILLALDMATEVFRKVNIPCYSKNVYSFCLHLFPDESLALIYSYCGNGSMEMWGMREEGNWIMRSRISSLERFDIHKSLLLGLWGDDEVLIMTREHNMTRAADNYKYIYDYELVLNKLSQEEMIRTVGHVRFSSGEVFIYKESMAAIRTTPYLLLRRALELTN